MWRRSPVDQKRDDATADQWLRFGQRPAQARAVGSRAALRANRTELHAEIEEELTAPVRDRDDGTPMSRAAPP